MRRADGIRVSIAVDDERRIPESARKSTEEAKVYEDRVGRILQAAATAPHGGHLRRAFARQAAATQKTSDERRHPLPASRVRDEERQEDLQDGTAARDDPHFTFALTVICRHHGGPSPPRKICGRIGQDGTVPGWEQPDARSSASCRSNGHGPLAAFRTSGDRERRLLSRGGDSNPAATTPRTDPRGEGTTAHIDTDRSTATLSRPHG